MGFPQLPPHIRQSVVTGFGLGTFAPVIPQLGDHFRPNLRIGRIDGYAEHALALIDHPEFHAPGLEKAKGSIEALSLMLEQWLTAQGVDVWGASLSINQHMPSYIEAPNYEDGFEDEEEAERIHAVPEWLHLHTQDCGLMAIGQVMDSIHQRHPVLAMVILSLIDITSSRTAWIATPTKQLEMADNLYWMGEGDESAALGDYVHDLDDEEALGGVVAMAHFVVDYPCYALTRVEIAELEAPQQRYGEQVGPFQRYELNHWNTPIEGDDESSALCRKVQTIALRLHSMLAAGASFPADSFGYWPQYLQDYPSLSTIWREPDEGKICLAQRLLDDQKDYNQQRPSSFEDCSIPLYQPQELVDALAQLQPGFQLLQELWSLLCVLKGTI